MVGKSDTSEYGLTESEVKEKFKKEYGNNWQKKLREFQDFIFGQTCALIDGELVYYYRDIKNFMRPKNKRFFD